MVKNKIFMGLILVFAIFAAVLFFLITSSGSEYGKAINCREVKCVDDVSTNCFKKCLNEESD